MAVTLVEAHDVTWRKHPQFLLLRIILVLIVIFLVLLHKSPLSSSPDQVQKNATVDTCRHMLDKKFGHCQVPLLELLRNFRKQDETQESDS